MEMETRGYVSKMSVQSIEFVDLKRKLMSMLIYSIYVLRAFKCKLISMKIKYEGLRIENIYS